ncbi:hypothetical protein A2V82_16520 [candidate division KSB1 bacterium RBG_16_48_16]|nr:MAG: hypothetical protein A2V82_16520 [candidate division KSB1 bacterium RBG_16_48_16]
MKIKVSSKPATFRRGGIQFTKEPQEIEVNQKTFDILKGETKLVVEQIEQAKAEVEEEVKVEEEIKKETKKGKGK